MIIIAETKVNGRHLPKELAEKVRIWTYVELVSIERQKFCLFGFHIYHIDELRQSCYFFVLITCGFKVYGLKISYIF